MSFISSQRTYSLKGREERNTTRIKGEFENAKTGGGVKCKKNGGGNKRSSNGLNSVMEKI